MEDFIFTPLVLLVGGALHSVARQRLTPSDTRLADVAFIVHVFAGFSQILLYSYYYGSGDMFGYHRGGTEIAEILRHSFTTHAPELVAAFFKQDFQFPADVGAPSSTLSMLVAAGFLCFALGNSLWAVTAAISIASLFSKMMIFAALEPEFPGSERRRLLTAVLFVPSAVFWTCALLKEPLVMVALGPLVLGGRYLIDGRRLLLSSVGVIVSSAIVLMIKPYIFLCVGIALAFWAFWRRMKNQRQAIVLSPIYLAFAGGIALVVLLLIGNVMPSLSISTLGEAVSSNRRSNAMEGGGSNYYLEDPDRSTESSQGISLASQLSLMPLALLTSLYRPLLFETRNVVQAINALETTWLIYLTIRLLQTRRLVVTELLSSPALVFCAVFTFMLGLGTGVATANLGSLSRYRSPMMPFFVVLLVMLRSSTRGTSRPPAGVAPREHERSLERA